MENKWDPVLTPHVISEPSVLFRQKHIFKTSARRAATANAKTLPSGPAVPPDSHSLPGTIRPANTPQHIRHSAVGNAKQIRLRLIPGEMKADSPPERSGLPDTVGQDKAEDGNRKNAQPILAGVLRMSRREECGLPVERFRMYHSAAFAN
jgi:hypothetical protein